MAESPAHRFGQVIGKLLEEILLPVLLEFCEGRGLYLDRHGERIGVREGRKVSWTDKYGNLHDLDFVVEKDGSSSKRGRPVAFIEAAWRRYTKHSRAKTQEIQGAVLPIAEKYDQDVPFLGAVLAGVFTQGSLDQLKSLGFEIVYLPYETIVEAFSKVGIDTRFDESTPDVSFEKCIHAIEALSPSARTQLKQHLLDSNKAGFDQFFTSLKKKLDRVIDRVVIVPLFGTAMTFTAVTEAIKFIGDFDIKQAGGDFQKFEVIVVYSNGDKIDGIFSEAGRAKDFLKYVTS